MMPAETGRGACDLSVVIPCYKDEPHLDRNTRRVMDTLALTRWTWEIILVNDCSPDRCGEICDRLAAEFPGLVRAVHHPKNTGRGRAVRDGIEAARGTVAGFLDIDLEVGAHYIPLMAAPLFRGEADVTVARRIYKLHLGLMHRTILSRGYVALMNTMLGMRLEDTEAGYKFFRRAAVLPLLAETASDGWFWDTEIVVRASLAGLRVAFPTVLFERDHTKQSTVRLFKDTADYFACLLRFRGEVRRIREKQAAREKTGAA